MGKVPDLNDVLSEQTVAKLISPDALVSQNAKLEDPVRVFAFAGIQRGAEIGRYTFVNRHAFISGNARIGRYCSISRAVEIGVTDNPSNMLSTHPFQYSKFHFQDVASYSEFARDYRLEPTETVVGHDVSIGVKSIILGGVTIGTGAVIGPNSFVDADIPPYAIAFGSPAKIVGYRFPEDIIDDLLKSNWWDLKPEEMHGMNFDDIELVLYQIAEAIEAKKDNQHRDDIANGKVDVSSDPVVVGLKQSLSEMEMPETVIDLVMAEAPTIAGMFDPSDKDDQMLLRNKLAYLMDFVSERDTEQLSINERKHIANLFRQKN